MGRCDCSMFPSSPIFKRCILLRTDQFPSDHSSERMISDCDSGWSHVSFRPPGQATKENGRRSQSPKSSFSRTLHSTLSPCLYILSTVDSSILSQHHTKNGTNSNELIPFDRTHQRDARHTTYLSHTPGQTSNQGCGKDEANGRPINHQPFFLVVNPHQFFPLHALSRCVVTRFFFHPCCLPQPPSRPVFSSRARRVKLNRSSSVTSQMRRGRKGRQRPLQAVKKAEGKAPQHVREVEVGTTQVGGDTGEAHVNPVRSSTSVGEQAASKRRLRPGKKVS